MQLHTRMHTCIQYAHIHARTRAHSYIRTHANLLENHENDRAVLMNKMKEAARITLANDISQIVFMVLNCKPAVDVPSYGGCCSRVFGSLSVIARTNWTSDSG